MVLFMLIQIPLGREYLKAAAPAALNLQSLSAVSEQASQYAYQIGMSAVGLAGLMLCYAFTGQSWFRGAWPSGASLVTGSFFAGWHRQSWVRSGPGFSIPGGLWEIFIGVWLIAKGFNKRALI